MPFNPRINSILSSITVLEVNYFSTCHVFVGFRNASLDFTQLSCSWRLDTYDYCRKFDCSKVIFRTNYSFVLDTRWIKVELMITIFLTKIFYAQYSPNIVACLFAKHAKATLRKSQGVDGVMQVAI